jgi:hypothetical protein
MKLGTWLNGLIYKILLILLLSCPLTSMGNYSCQLVFNSSLEVNPDFWLKHTLGIEAELVIPSNLTFNNVAEILTKYIKQNNPDSQVTRKIEYDIAHGRDVIVVNQLDKGIVKRWEIGEDLSIVPPNGFRGVEIASPVLKDSNDLNFWYQFLDKLNEHGAQSVPRSGGTHFHTRMLNLTGRKIILLTSLWSKIEEEIHSLLKTSYNRKKFTPIYPKTLKLELNMYMEKLISDLNIEWDPNEVISLFKDYSDPHILSQSTTRYSLDVLSSMRRYGTFEFRIFSSTNDPKLMQRYVDFISRLLVRIEKNDFRLYELQGKYLEQKIPLWELEKITGSQLSHPNAAILKSKNYFFDNKKWFKDTWPLKLISTLLKVE